jgi:uncharacterized pyridoxamine 5'-phosphate oxidase family protein
MYAASSGMNKQPLLRHAHSKPTIEMNCALNNIFPVLDYNCSEVFYLKHEVPALISVLLRRHFSFSELLFFHEQIISSNK